MPKIELHIVSNKFGAEKKAEWDWCDVLCLPTLSDNLGLVIAEALERGKSVITTDGAPAWKPKKVEVQSPSRTKEINLHSSTSTSTSTSTSSSDFDSRLTYLTGYRGGDDKTRVQLLKSALVN